MGSTYPPPSSPPPAYPPALPGRTPSQNLPLAAPPSWTRPGTFYLNGSAAPSHIAHRRPTYNSRHSEYGPPLTAPPNGPPPLGQQPTDGADCACCATPVRFPRGSFSFRCTVCGTINDLDKPRVIGYVDSNPAARPPPRPRPTPVTEDEVLRLHRWRGRRGSASSTSSDLPSRLSELALYSDDHPDPDSALFKAVQDAFANLESVDASFRPSPQAPGARTLDPNAPPLPPRAPSSSVLPKYTTLRLFYSMVKRRPACLEELRRLVGALLMRPGPNLHKSDGGWLLVLVEAPVFYSEGTPEAAHRHHLVCSLLGLMSNVPNDMHHALVALYMSSVAHPYPRDALLSKVELVVSFVSSRIGRASEDGYEKDWAVRAGAKTGALLFAANTNQPRLPVSSFYCTLVDVLGETAMVESFLRWESRNGFSLCSYPFLLSLGVKIHLLNFDGQRQMEDKAREALISTLTRRMLEIPFLHLKVRRTHLVSDSLEQISANRINLKKMLKVSFVGEDGIDAGGLRKEWFLLLCRQLFDPQWGMFVHDPESNLCWFNPASQDFDEFYLVGVVVGLACYNAATLDVPLPTAVYKKLQDESIGLRDLAILRPSLSRGLQQMLDYEGDVEDTFCRSFVGEIEEWGEVREVELCPGGKDKAVDNHNRHDFVRLYVDFLLNASVSEQFKAFSSGFAQVTSGNSLSLFKGEELELLVRGSSEELDIEQLQHVTVYSGWTEDHETVKLFWHIFTTFEPESQRALLSFITGSDRIPATGTSALTLKITNMGPDVSRFPTSHTCFNELCLHEYRDEPTLRQKLRTAMDESEGFGLR